MTLEVSIKDVISKKLEDGTVEKIMEEQLEKGVTKALESLFSSYGDVTKVIEKKVKEVMVPYLEGYDYSEYITKLDHVLVEVLKSSALENKKLLTNFKSLMVTEDAKKTITVSELFEEWKQYVAKNVETDGLDIDYDDSPSYEYVEVEFQVEEDESNRSWSSFEHATIVFECEHDEKMNVALRLSRWKEGKKKEWDYRYEGEPNLKSLRHLNDFDVFLMKLSQNYTNIVVDKYSDDDSVQPEKEPEVSFS